MGEGDIRNAALNAESDTLGTQLKNVKATITSQRRVLALNESYSKKMAMYTRLILAIIFALAISILLKILKDKFQIIPDSVITLVYILLFSSCAVYGMFIISDINSRQTTDFDKLELSPPGAVSKQMYNHVPKLGSLDLLPGYCIGANCCSATTATVWDDANENCKIGCPNGTKYVDNADGTGKTCADCPAGQTASGTETTCTACPAGQYSVSGKGCMGCAAGTYSATTGATTCAACASGTTSAAGSSACVAIPS